VELRGPVVERPARSSTPDLLALSPVLARRGGRPSGASESGRRSCSPRDGPGRQVDEVVEKNQQVLSLGGSPSESKGQGGTTANAHTLHRARSPPRAPDQAAGPAARPRGRASSGDRARDRLNGGGRGEKQQLRASPRPESLPTRWSKFVLAQHALTKAALRVAITLLAIGVETRRIFRGILRAPGHPLLHLITQALPSRRPPHQRRCANVPPVPAAARPGECRYQRMSVGVPPGPIPGRQAHPLGGLGGIGVPPVTSASQAPGRSEDARQLGMECDHLHVLVESVTTATSGRARYCRRLCTLELPGRGITVSKQLRSSAGLPGHLDRW